MHQLISCLEKIVNKELILLDSSKRKQQSHVEIYEDTKDKGLKKILINGLPSSILTFKLENGKIKNNRIATISKSENGNISAINQSCDAIIVFEHSNQIIIFFCELKSFDPSGFDKQIIGSELFVNYLLSAIQEFEDINVEIVPYYVLIHLKRPPSVKHTSRPNHKHFDYEKKNIGKRAFHLFSFEGKTGVEHKRQIDFSDLMEKINPSTSRKF